MNDTIHQSSFDLSFGEQASSRINKGVIVINISLLYHIIINMSIKRRPTVKVISTRWIEVHMPSKLMLAPSSEARQIHMENFRR